MPNWLIELFLVVGGVATPLLTAYLLVRVKDLATKAEIEELTSIEEGVRAFFRDQSEVTIRKRDIYAEMSQAFQVFLEGHTDRGLLAKLPKTYYQAWIWASDDIVRAANTFIDMNVRVPAAMLPGQDSLKQAYFEVFILMRRDAGHPDTTLTFADFRFLQPPDA